MCHAFHSGRPQNAAATSEPASLWTPNCLPAPLLLCFRCKGTQWYTICNPSTSVGRFDTSEFAFITRKVLPLGMIFHQVLFYFLHLAHNCIWETATAQFLIGTKIFSFTAKPSMVSFWNFLCPQEKSRWQRIMAKPCFWWMPCNSRSNEGIFKKSQWHWSLGRTTL